MPVKPSLFPVLLATLLLTGGCQTMDRIQGQRTLKAAEARSLFVGRTVESYNLNNGTTSHTYYKPNGTALQKRKGKRRVGTWKIRKDGEICLDFTGRKCRYIIEKDGTYYKVRKNKYGKRERIIVYKSFRKGNRLGFYR